MRNNPPLLRKWRSFRSYPLASLFLIPIAFVLLGLARAVILLLPFRHYAPLFGRREVAKSDAHWRVGPPLDKGKEARAAAIKRAVHAASRITPWQSVCMPQAMVAALLMRASRIAYAVHLGVAHAHDDDAGAGRALPPKLKAHAWSVAGTMIVTGPGQLDRFTRVAQFTHDPSLRGY